MTEGKHAKALAKLLHNLADIVEEVGKSWDMGIHHMVDGDLVWIRFKIPLEEELNEDLPGRKCKRIDVPRSNGMEDSGQGDVS